MEESNINLVLIIACLVAGSGIGALGYHLLGSSARQTQQLRQRLAETERQLTVMRSGLGEHVERLASMAQTLNRDTQALVQEVSHTSSSLGIEPSADTAETISASTGKTGLHTPRDYADGNSGTLSEDFGLKQSTNDSVEPPARH